MFLERPSIKEQSNEPACKDPSKTIIKPKHQPNPTGKVQLDNAHGVLDIHGLHVHITPFSKNGYTIIDVMTETKGSKETKDDVIALESTLALLSVVGIGNGVLLTLVISHLCTHVSD